MISVLQIRTYVCASYALLLCVFHSLRSVTIRRDSEGSFAAGAMLDNESVSISIIRIIPPYSAIPLDYVHVVLSLSLSLSLSYALSLSHALSVYLSMCE